MDEMLQEFVNSRGVDMRVDRGAGVIRGVKLLGLESRNGRSYLPAALAQAAAPVRRGQGQRQPSQGQPAGGPRLSGSAGLDPQRPCASGEGLFGDLHFNPKHALAEQLAWDAAHAPENVGFSHNVEARTSRAGGQTVVEAILEGAKRRPGGRSGHDARPVREHGTIEPSADERAIRCWRADARQLRAGAPTWSRRSGRAAAEAIGAARSKSSGCGRRSGARQRAAAASRAVARVQPARSRPRRRPPSRRWSASSSWSRCWPRPTSRPCGRWSKSGPQLIAAARATRPRHRRPSRPHRASSIAASRDDVALDAEQLRPGDFVADALARPRATADQTTCQLFLFYGEI